MKWIAFGVIIFVLYSLPGCTNRDADSNPISHSDLDISRVYADYRVNAEEGDDKLNVMIRYHENGSNGPTLVIHEPGKVELDGKQLKVDSSGLTGAYYETQELIDGFTGDHEILLSLGGEKSFVESFHFEPMVLINLPDTLHRSGARLVLQGVNEDDRIRLILADTSFTSEGVNRLDSSVNGELEITGEDFEKVKNGSLHIELYRETERIINRDKGAGGRLTMTYIIKRDLILVD